MESLGPRLPDERFPTLTHVWVAALFTVIVVRALAWPIPPNDFWWQLAYGRWIVEHGEVPRVDHFSFTHGGEPHFDQPWLAQVVLFGVYRAGGAALSLVLLAVALVLTYGLMLKMCAARASSVKLAALLLILSLPVAMTNWSVRSQILAMPLFAGTLVVLGEWRSGRAPPPSEVSRHDKPGARRHRLWLLPIFMLLWVNLHGSFVLGGVVIAIALTVEAISGLARKSADGPASDAPAGGHVAARLAPLMLWGGLAGLATLANPRGTGVYGYVFGLAESPAIQTIVEEWMPPTVHTVVGKAFFGWVALVTLVTLLARRRSDPADAALAVILLWLALGGERHVMWFALGSLPLLAGQAAALPRLGRASTTSAGRRGLNLLLLGFMAATVVTSLPPIKSRLPIDARLRPLIDPRTPVEAVRALRADPRAPERLFHSEAAGSYLMWAAPDRKVFVDVRVMLYPRAFLEDYRRISAGIDADSLLRRYRVDGLLLENDRQAALLSWAEATGEWEVRHRDTAASYLVRREGSTFEDAMLPAETPMPAGP